MKKILIIGGVAGGMSAATRLRRLDPEASIIVLERSGHVSYANCGLPYFVGGVIEDHNALLLQTPESLHASFRLDVRVNHDVLSVNAEEKFIVVRDLLAGTESQYPYDYLVMSPGALPVVPPLPGIELARWRNDAVASFGAQSQALAGQNPRFDQRLERALGKRRVFEGNHAVVAAHDRFWRRQRSRGSKIRQNLY